MGNFKKISGAILGLFIMAFGVGFILFYVYYLDDKVNTQPVVVAVKEIPFKAVITADMVEIQERKVHTIVDGSFKDLRQVIGQQSAVRIAPNTQLYDDLLDPHNVIPGEGEEIFPIPDQWIYAKPGSLRRTFRVNFYAFKASDHAQPMIQIDSIDDVLDLNLDEPILESVVVAYAKDSSNREVVGLNQEDIRLDASGHITNLDVVLTRDKFNLIKSYISQGYKLIIAYD